MGPLKSGRPRRNVQVRSKMSDNPHYSPSTSLAYLILAGTSGWAIRHTTLDTPWALGTFSFLLGHSIVGIVQFSHPNNIEAVTTIFEQCSLIAEVLPLPMINMELYMLNGFPGRCAALHVLGGLIPLGTQFVTEEHNDKIIDIVIAGNIISLLYLTITNDCPWAGGLAALVCLNHFVFQRVADRMEVPKLDIVAIGMSFCNIFAVNCLCEAKSKG